MATSGCALAAARFEGAGNQSNANAQAQQKSGVKIMVLKRGFEKDLVDQLKSGTKGPCARFTDGQEFTVKSQWAMPEKFCGWAYADIRTHIPMVLGNGNPIAVCRTDGYRPVFFEVERIAL